MRILNSRLAAADNGVFDLDDAASLKGALRRGVRAAGRGSSTQSSVMSSNDALFAADRLSRKILMRPNLRKPGALIRMLCALARTRGSDEATRMLSALPEVRKSWILPAGDSGTTSSNSLADSHMPRAKRNEPMRIVRDRKHETVLLRDVLYAFQGIDGHLVRYDGRASRYVVAPNVAISPALRHIVGRLCELGWIFRHVCKLLREMLGEQCKGMVAQSFAYALQEELTSYYKFIAVLEAQITEGLSLRKLIVWTQEPLRRMRVMAELADSVCGLSGGALASAVDRYSVHGDPEVRNFVGALISRLSAPIFSCIKSWVFRGELDDPFLEFFIACRAEHAQARSKVKT